MEKTQNARFGIGQLIQHSLFGYRGVVIDVDPVFQGTEEWYLLNAPGNPPKENPWYHILVHGSAHHVYAAEMHLIEDNSGDPIEHPEIDYFFLDFKKGAYQGRKKSN